MRSIWRLCSLLVVAPQLVQAAEILWFPFDHNENPPDCGFGCYVGHSGLDYKCPEGTDIYSAIDGTVVTVVENVSGQVCNSPNYGNYVKIQNNQHNLQVIEAHLLEGSVVVNVGQTVIAGQYIGKSSNSGYTLALNQEGEYECGIGGAYHLHFEVRVLIEGIWTAVNPDTYDGGLWTNPLQYGNGTPTPTFIATQTGYSVTPNGPYTPGQTIQCSVTWRNDGTATWSSTPGSAYIELGSCNSTGTIVSSYLYASGLGWLGNSVPCTFNGASVTPGNTATFSFTGKIPQTASPGVVPIYFGPVYNASIMDNWNGNGFTITVANPAPPTYTPALRLDVNGGGGASDLLIADMAYGNVWAAISDGYGSFNPQPLQCQGMSPTGVSEYLSGDVDGDGKVDAIAVDRYAGNIRVAKSNGWNVTSPTIWRTGWQGGSVSKFFAGYFNANGYADVLSYYSPTGAFQVVISNATCCFNDAPGPYSYGAWLIGWAVQALGAEQYEIAIGDVNGDKLTDIVAFEQNPGNLYVALNSGQNSFVAQSMWLGNFCYGSVCDLFMADVTGDGKDDAVLFYKNAGTWQVAASTGSSFVPSGGSAPYGNWITGWGSYLTTPIFGKFVGGDAKFDIALHEYVSGTVQMARSTGTSFEYVAGSGIGGTWIQNFCTAGWDPGRMVSLQRKWDPLDRDGIVEGQAQWSLSPNPASEMLNIAFSKVVEPGEECRIVVTDVSGREVFQERVLAGRSEWQINVSRFSAGLYFVTVFSNRSNRTQKLLVLQ